MALLKDFTQKEMTRKEFLLTLGLGFASILGFSTIIELLTGKRTHQYVTNGYGSQSYGKQSEDTHKTA